MPPLPQILNLDVQIDNAGHSFHLKASSNTIVASFPSITSLWHFFRKLRAYRKRIPPPIQLQVICRGLRIK